MATFLAGSGPLFLGDPYLNYSSIYYVASENSCLYDDTSGGFSLYHQWNTNYAFSPEFNAPYNMGFFYGQGCPGTIQADVNFYVDPYNENFADWGLYFKVGTTGTETLIENLGYNRSSYDECVRYIFPVSTKGGLGQSGNTVYVGIRKIGKAATPAYYDAVGVTYCPGSLNYDYGGTYDYPGSCPGQYSDFLESSFAMKFGITVAVDKSGYVVTC